MPFDSRKFLLESQMLSFLDGVEKKTIFTREEIERIKQGDKI